MVETRYVGWSSGNSTYICDGTADDVQINQALSWAASNPGNTIYLRGPYTYDIQQPLEIGNDTTLTGDPTACLKLHAGVTWAHQIHIIKQSETVVENITIHGFEIDANRDHQNYSEGDGYHNCIGLRGNSNNPGQTITIYDMYMHDSLGDGCRIQFCEDVIIHDNQIDVMGHEDVFLIQVVGAEVYDNTFKQKCNSCVRTDNCQKIKIHDNTMNKSGYTSGAGNSAVQIGNEPANYGLTKLTQEIEIYNNIINEGAGSGILLMDAWRTAGTTAQTVHIHHNILTGCGWSHSYQYNAGISCWYWGNGAIIEKNTVTGSYNAGILIYGAYSGCTIQINDNNIVNTVKTQATDSSKKLPVSGYGFLNMVPSRMSVRAEDNYTNGNVTGGFYQVVPLTEATAYITDALPGGNSTEDDVDDITDPSTGEIYIPAVRQLQKDDDYYIEGRSGYINGVPFKWMNKKIDVAKSSSQDKCPGSPGWALTDFDLEGAELVLDCWAPTLLELYTAVAALKKPGRINIELGGAYADYQASGILGDYSTDVPNDIDPNDGHPYSFSLLMDLPCYESVIEKIRSRYISSTGQFTSDNCYKGNIVSNSSFEYWSLDQSLEWESATNPADVNFQKIRWAKELRMFCAVANTGTDNRVLVYDTSWRLPTGLNCANKNNDWGGLCWCPDWTLWVAMATSGTAGYLCMTSPDTDNWTAKATPSGADGFAWGSSLFIPPDETLTTGRVIAFASSGTGNRIIYSDNQCATWTQVASAIDTNAWKSADYSPELNRICCVANAGSATQRVQTSDNYGATWTAQTCPEQAWESVRWISALSLFVACSSDGTQQIMTSPTGLSGTWTLQDTPVLGSEVVPGSGSDVRMDTYKTPTGYNYSTPSTTYNDDAGVPDTVIPALTNGNIWRVDRVYCSLRAQYSGHTAYCKATIQAASLYSGVETQIAEWTETSTTYQTKSLDLSIESATNETVTIRFYGKTSNAGSKTVITLAGCEVTEFDGDGGSTISYIRGEWKDLEYSPELNVVVCVSQTSVADAATGEGNGIMYSTNTEDWISCITPDDIALQSVAYSAYLNMFAAVASSGTGNRIMTSDTFGAILGPENWTLGDGAARSSDTAIDGIYSLSIIGDGVTVEKSVTTQKLSIESGARYIISGYCTIEDLTAGSGKIDVLVGNAVVKELSWTADCDWSQKQISFKQTVIHDDIYLRVYGYNLNSGASIKFDKILVEKSSDFEQAATGADIMTLGTEDVVPDVIITGTEYNPDGSAAGESITYTAPAGEHVSSVEVAYVLIHTAVLPTRTDGGVYRLDKVFTQLKSYAGHTAYCKVTVQATSFNLGNEFTVATWTTQSTDYVDKTRNVARTFAVNESVTIKFYIQIASSSDRVYAEEMGYTYTEMSSTDTTYTEDMYIWNTQDVSKVMKCLDIIYPKYTMEINRDGTGSLSYAEDFLTENILYIADSYSICSYDSANKSLIIGAGGEIVLPFDCMCPVAGIPSVTMFATYGTPHLSIALDSAGSPGTWYEIDGDQDTVVDNSEIYRLLDNEDDLRLNANTKFYLKIAQPSGYNCEITSLYVYAPTSTIDVERFKIYVGGVNTIGVQVTGRSSVIATLRFKDWVPAV